MNLCKCGCGELCNRTYIKGHNVRGIPKFHLRGKRRPEETKQKISAALKGIPKSKEHNRKNSESKKGKKRPAYIGKKISAAKKGKSSWNKGIPWSEEEKRKRVNFFFREENFKGYYRSKPEIEFGKQIEKHFGIKLHSSKFLKGRFFDYCYEPNKILIECDGEYWHSLPYMVENDKLKNKIAKDNGYKLVRYALNTQQDVKVLIKNKFNELTKLFNK